MQEWDCTVPVTDFGQTACGQPLSVLPDHVTDHTEMWRSECDTRVRGVPNRSDGYDLAVTNDLEPADSPSSRQLNAPRQLRSVLLATIALTALAAGCGSDSTTPPATTTTGSGISTTPIEGGAGVPLEPGSNLPPDQVSPTPGGTTGTTSDLLAPASETDGG